MAKKDKKTNKQYTQKKLHKKPKIEEYEKFEDTKG